MSARKKKKPIITPEAVSVGYGLYSIMETLRQLPHGTDMRVSRVCDLHAEFTPARVKAMVRLLESEYLLMRAGREADWRLWLTVKGRETALTHKEMQWQELAVEFLGE